MSLATYDEARPWARAIREEVLARRMPRWPIVRGYGDFANDRSLSPFEIALITAWVDGGAPRTLPKGVPTPAARLVPARVPAPFIPPATARTTTLPCTARRLPAGTVLGFTPTLAKGGSLKMTLTRKGLEEPLMWLKDFDPDLPETYWLRTPLESSGALSIETMGGEPCRLSVVLAARTGKS